MLIAQLTDIHIGFDPASPREANLLRLEQALAHIAALPNRPDLLLLTGDLTEHGTPESYATLRNALATSGIPAYPIPGNHDRRDPLVAAFPDIATDQGFVHYAIEQADFRILMLDTMDDGRHGGAFCAVRANWLGETLGRRPDTPTLIAMHHPPFAAGISWMDTDPAEPWVERFRTAIDGHRQIRAIVSGHVHRACVSSWAGQVCMICPSTAPAVALDFSPISDLPDGRALIADAPPGYALHYWDGAALASHFITACPTTTLAHYTPALRSMVTGMLAERPTPA